MNMNSEHDIMRIIILTILAGESSTNTAVIIIVPDISAIRCDSLLDEDPSMQGGGVKAEQQ